MTMNPQWQTAIDDAVSGKRAISDEDVRNAILEIMEALDRGIVRVAESEPSHDTSNDESRTVWRVNAWVKQAILYYFQIAEMKVLELPPFEYFDKIPLKRGFDRLGVRVVPPATVRYGSFVERGAVIMPGYVNIGAWVGAGTMVDTWATVGSCAQIGKHVHLSGGVGVGGVLEPPQALPVIVEDGAFIGSRCILVEGVLIGREAVLGANVTLTASTPIIDVSGKEEIIYKGYVPPRSVVIPAMRTKPFPAGEYPVPCALIIGKRQPSTDRKTSLNQVLRQFSVAV